MGDHALHQRSAHPGFGEGSARGNHRRRVARGSTVVALVGRAPQVRPHHDSKGLGRHIIETAVGGDLGQGNREPAKDPRSAQRERAQERCVRGGHLLAASGCGPGGVRCGAPRSGVHQVAWPRRRGRRDDWQRHRVEQPGRHLTKVHLQGSRSGVRRRALHKGGRCPRFAIREQGQRAVSLGVGQGGLPRAEGLCTRDSRVRVRACQQRGRPRGQNGYRRPNVFWQCREAEEESLGEQRGRAASQPGPARRQRPRHSKGQPPHDTGLQRDRGERAAEQRSG
mmetsp:Transcript_26544/g.99903  ORF Transcript_26544/g.99903 Transcript_26544/m.99903 type:complete len:281 (-) Transcript_26544:1436-2278(-)